MSDEPSVAKSAANEDKAGGRPFAEPGRSVGEPDRLVADSSKRKKNKTKSGAKDIRVSPPDIKIAPPERKVVAPAQVPSLFEDSKEPTTGEMQNSGKAVRGKPGQKQLTPLQRAALGLSPDQVMHEVLDRIDEGAERKKRRSRWHSSLKAFQYVSKISRDDDVRIRDSDRATGIFLAIATALTFMSLVVPSLAPHRLPFVLVCDVLVGVMLALYVANRLGILSTLRPRQALLAWQLIVGAAFLGVFITVNLAILIGAFVATMSMR